MQLWIFISQILQMQFQFLPTLGHSSLSLEATEPHEAIPSNTISFIAEEPAVSMWSLTAEPTILYTPVCDPGVNIHAPVVVG